MQYLLALLFYARPARTARREGAAGGADGRTGWNDCAKSWADQHLRVIRKLCIL